MLNVLFRGAAPWACAWIAWMSAVHAAEAAPAEQAEFSPFKHYQQWLDQDLQDWREANQRVGEIGGWRTYLREAQQGDGADQGDQSQRVHNGH